MQQRSAVRIMTLDARGSGMLKMPWMHATRKSSANRGSPSPTSTQRLWHRLCATLVRRVAAPEGSTWRYQAVALLQYRPSIAALSSVIEHCASLRVYWQCREHSGMTAGTPLDRYTGASNLPVLHPVAMDLRGLKSTSASPSASGFKVS